MDGVAEDHFYTQEWISEDGCSAPQEGLTFCARCGEGLLPGQRRPLAVRRGSWSSSLLPEAQHKMKVKVLVVVASAL